MAATNANANAMASQKKIVTKRSLSSDMDRCVKQMLKLIDDEGDSFAKKAEMYYQKRPILIAHVEDFHRMFKSLAERYDHLAEQQPPQPQGSAGINDLPSEPTSPKSSSNPPDRKPLRRKSSGPPRAAGFDFFLGPAGGGSDASSIRKDGDDSSSSSPGSASDSDGASSSINKYSSQTQLHGDREQLRRRIIELEIELGHANEKLRLADEINTQGSSRFEELQSRFTQYEQELRVANENLRLSTEEIDKLKLQLEETDLSQRTHDLQVKLQLTDTDIQMPETETENKSEESQVWELRKRIRELEATILVAGGRIEALMGELNITKQNLQGKEQEIVSLTLELEKRGSLEANHKAQVSEMMNRINRLESSVLDRDCNIETLEETLGITKEKLGWSEEEIAKLKDEMKKNESSESVGGLQIDQLESAGVSGEEAEIGSEKRWILELQEQIVRYKTDISDRDNKIKELQAAISKTKENFSQEKSRLKAEISRLSREVAVLEAKVKEWESMGHSLEEEIKRVESEKTEMQSVHGIEKVGMQGEIEELKAEIWRRVEEVETLNKSFETLKQEYDVLISERDGMNDKVQTLLGELTGRDEQIHKMGDDLEQLRNEQMEVKKGCEGTHILVEELQSRAKQLEEEVEKQRTTIVDRSEEKREAIRQLCFSLDHYRDENQKLRQAYLTASLPSLVYNLL
nr:TPA_asm: hypothetical protein HUJ06_027218 [Nelumbo nucifera]